MKQQSNYFDIYLCKYHWQESPVPRHYTTGYSVCTQIATLPETEVKVLISKPNTITQSLPSEITITDIASINSLLEKLKVEFKIETVLGEPEEVYVYLVIKRRSLYPNGLG